MVFQVNKGQQHGGCGFVFVESAVTDSVCLDAEGIKDPQNYINFVLIVEGSHSSRCRLEAESWHLDLNLLKF